MSNPPAIAAASSSVSSSSASVSARTSSSSSSSRHLTSAQQMQLRERRAAYRRSNTLAALPGVTADTCGRRTQLTPIKDSPVHENQSTTLAGDRGNVDGEPDRCGLPIDDLQADRRGIRVSMICYLSSSEISGFFLFHSLNKSLKSEVN